MKHVFKSHRDLCDAWIIKDSTHGLTSRFGQRGELVFKEKLPQVLCVGYDYPIALRVDTVNFLIKSTVEKLDYSTRCKIGTVGWRLHKHNVQPLNVLDIPKSGDINDPDWLQSELVKTQGLLMVCRDKATRARRRQTWWLGLARDRYAEFQKLMELTGRKGVGEYELRKTMDDIETMWRRYEQKRP